ncbi:MAG: TMEM143 family protein [Myxococcota bacterium]|nr:TMEM143 family protein [Myxococcota bacterium]
MSQQPVSVTPSLSPFQLSQSPYEAGWIEEGLYYRGETPPSGHGKSEDWVQIPHEGYIPVSKAQVVHALQRRAGNASEGEFHHFCELMEGLYHFYYHRTLNELKEDYEYFSPTLGTERREGVGETELLQRERRFLLNFIQLMIRGNFNPLRSKEYEEAQAHAFLLDLPVDADWSRHDPRLLQGLYSYSESQEGIAAVSEKLEQPSLANYLDPPEECRDNILVFHRGIAPEKVEGLFLLQKLNIIVDRVIGFFPGLFEKSVDSTLETTKGVAEKVGGALGIGKGDENASVSRESEEEAQVIFQSRWLRRTSLQNQEASFSWLKSKSLLQEPALERVVCLFRGKPQAPLLQRLPVINKLIKAKPEGPADPTIFVKIFKDIPMADLEMVFPEKKLKMRPFDKMVLTIVIMIAAVMGVIKLNSKGDFSLMPVLITGGLLVFKTITGFLRTRMKYIARMAQEMYHKNMDTDTGVLQYLVDSIEEQEFKEAAIAYILLLEAGEALTEEELDERAEAFLNENFRGLEVDFEVDDALDKLIDDGSEVPARAKRIPLVKVIEGEGETRYQAIGFKEALVAMDGKWDRLFEYAD